jgi:hypothetical protein
MKLQALTFRAETSLIRNDPAIEQLCRCLPQVLVTGKNENAMAGAARANRGRELPLVLPTDQSSYEQMKRQLLFASRSTAPAMLGDTVQNRLRLCVGDGAVSPLLTCLPG